MTRPESGGRELPRFPLLGRAWPPLVGLLLTALLATVARRPFRAFDTYFHLRFGQEFRGDWSLADPGQLSGASSNDWLPTQWLPQVALSVVDEAFGTVGLVVAFAALLAAFAAAVHLLLRSRCGPGTAVLLTAVVLVGCLPNLSLRPQVLSFVLIALTVGSWDIARRTGRVPWWLVPLAWLWAVSHGMWVLGIAASAVLAAAVWLERRPARAGTLRLLAVPLGMLLAACLTPAGPRLVSAVVLVSSRAEHFHEWRAPALITLDVAPVTCLLVLAVLLMVRRGPALPYDVALLALGGGFAVYSQRTLPLALVVLAAVVATEVERLHEARGRGRPSPGRRELAVVGALGLAVVVLSSALPRIDGDAAEYAAFNERLAALPAGTVVLTDRTTGAVLLWEHQQLDVPLHGYGDVYTDAELDEYDAMVDLEPGWDSTVTEIGASVALLPDDEPLAGALRDRGWTVAQEAADHVYLVAGQPDAAATQRSSTD